MAALVANGHGNALPEGGREFHEQQLQIIETEYTGLKQQLVEAKLKHVETALEELNEGIYAKLTQGLLDIENETERDLKKAARERDARLETAKAWLDVEREAALNNVKTFAMRVRYFHDSLHAQVINLKRAKKEMDADPPPYEARHFRVQARTPIWDASERNKRSALYTPESARMVAKAAEMELLQPHTVTTPAAVSRSRRETHAVITASNSRLEAKRQRRAVSHSGPCIIYNLLDAEIEADLDLMLGRRKRGRGRPRRR
eukprot:TRINITY_DN5780_c0_g1_i2.p1 TRINITY_DN5780_c0_g1~~TRINITY_DN5780_c0_g1_i2.p1  ORF type:complete len:260 (+),score=52.48 TRINITY_DN5780_c0_g1_i2:320-1099(+)